ncbi:MAG TPA: FeS-binding protein [Dehalococcoidia bacterium]|nr:FeS-binding protein [Dehalococcoidia bacterium]
MAKRRVKFTFPPHLITEPVIYNLGKQFGVVTNIFGAKVTKEFGWVVLELEGTEADIQRGIDWAIAQGVQVEPVESQV